MKLFKKIWQGMRNLFAKANEAALTAIPVAVDVVQLVKQVADSGILSIPFSMLKGMIAGPQPTMRSSTRVNTFLRTRAWRACDPC